MEYPWLRMLSSLLILNTTVNRTDPTWIGLWYNRDKKVLINIFIVGLYIALKLIENQRLVE